MHSRIRLKLRNVLQSISLLLLTAIDEHLFKKKNSPGSTLDLCPFSSLRAPSMCIPMAAAEETSVLRDATTVGVSLI